MASGIPDPYTSAVQDFHQMRRQATLQDVLARLTGRSSALLSFDEVAAALRVVSWTNQGRREIPLDAIVGSVGRYDDFTRTFLPRYADDAERWASVKVAMQKQMDLPPIKVYQVGDAYFVLDGNHRVSIARQEGWDTIRAEVTKVETRASLEPGMRPDELIIKAEYADFLERTGLDRLRPGADLMVSAPGQYQVLENLIDIYRYCTESIEQCMLTNPVVVMRWYDEDYLPVVEAIREQGILRYFPGRTETDLYVWLLLNQADLRRELGWDVRPVELVKLAEQYRPQPARRASVLLGGLLRRATSEAEPGQPGRASWSGDWIGQQHGHTLFPLVLVAAEPGEQDWTGLDQALLVAGAEGSRLFGLCVVAEPASGDVQVLAEAFSERSRDAGVEGRFGVEAGSLSDRISQRGLLADLVVVNCGLGGQPENRQAFTPEIAEVLQRCARPVLVVPGLATSCGRVLVALDNHTRAREALMVATYMARRWGADLQALVVTERGDSGYEVTAEVRQYLDEHGIAASISICDGDAAETILHIAQDQERDLIVMGSYSGGWLRQRLRGNVVNRVLEQAALPVLVCP